MKLSITILFSLLLSTTLAAQTSVEVSSKTILYKRFVGSDKTFDVKFPFVSGVYTPQVKKYLKRTLNPFRAIGMTLAEVQEDGSTYHIGYEVAFNKGGILSLVFIQETLTGNPATYRFYVTADLRTGKELNISNIFTNKRKKELLKDIRNTIRKRFDLQKSSQPCFEGVFTDYRSTYGNSSMLLPEEVGFDHLVGFYISDRGVTFVYSYGFPFNARACEPNEKYLLTWKQLKPFIRRDGLLGQFIR